MDWSAHGAGPSHAAFAAEASEVASEIGWGGFGEGTEGAGAGFAVANDHPKGEKSVAVDGGGEDGIGGPQGAEKRSGPRDGPRDGQPRETRQAGPGARPPPPAP